MPNLETAVNPGRLRILLLRPSRTGGVGSQPVPDLETRMPNLETAVNPGTPSSAGAACGERQVAGREGLSKTFILVPVSTQCCHRLRQGARGRPSVPYSSSPRVPDIPNLETAVNSGRRRTGEGAIFGPCLSPGAA